MMRRCKNCDVTVLDETMVCPLCRSVLEVTDEAGAVGTASVAGSKPEAGSRLGAVGTASVAGSKPEAGLRSGGMYPNVKNASRALNLVVKMYIFLAILTEAALIVINYLTFSGIWWSAISGVVILYFYMTLRYAVLRNTGYRSVLVGQIVGGVLVTVVIDYIIGYRGWSVDYVLPSAILLFDVAIIVLMLVNQENWQSYILLQILAVLFGIGALVLWGLGIIRHPLLACIAAAVSAVVFIGTLIFGDRRAKAELKRRFRI